MRDRQLEVYELFEREARRRVTALLTEEVIAEHAANPAGPHSDALQRVLRVLRRAPIDGRYVAVAVRPWAEYRVAVFAAPRGVAPTVLDEGPYLTEEQAVHAIFLKRVEQLRTEHA